VNTVSATAQIPTAFIRRNLRFKWTGLRGIVVGVGVLPRKFDCPFHAPVNGDVEPIAHAARRLLPATSGALVAVRTALGRCFTRAIIEYAVLEEIVPMVEM